jgi:hypothetical protein
MRECQNRMSCSRSDSRVVRTTVSINLTDPAVLPSFRGPETLPIQVVTEVRHWSFCNWREDDDSFPLIRDFLEYHFSCPSMRSSYRATCSFGIAVNYASYARGFHDPEPKAVPGGP